MRFEFNKKDLFLYLFFFIVCIFLSIETWVLGIYSYLPLHDAGDAQVPVFYSYIQQVKKYGFSANWFPLHLAGNDQSATYSIFTLIGLIFYMFPMWKAYALTLFMQHLVAIFAMYFSVKLNLILIHYVHALQLLHIRVQWLS